MMFKLTRAAGRGTATFVKPPNLPCGCRVVGHAQIVGLDGVPLPGVTGCNTKTGWIRVQRWVIDRSLVRDVEGKAATTREGIENVDCVAPFEIHCKVHGKLDEPEVHAGHGKGKSLCACGVTPSAACCAAYGCARCAEALYRAAGEKLAAERALTQKLVTP